MISWTLKNEVERGKGTKFPTAPQNSQTFHKMNFQTPPETRLKSDLQNALQIFQQNNLQNVSKTTEQNSNELEVS